MSESSSLSALTREQLYELVWSHPGTKVAAQLGVSDVAIAKRFRVLGVPRPERGYWAKLAVGKAEKKPALPPLPPSPSERFVAQAQMPIAADTALPDAAAPLHPLAAQFLAAVQKAPLSYDKQRVDLRERELPEASISKAQAPRAAQALHALLHLLEPRGVLFKRSRSKYDGGCFRKGTDDLHLKIEEALIERPEGTTRRRRYYYSSPQENKVAGGKLTFSLNSDRYGREAEKQWTESDKLPLETIVSEMAKEVTRHYVDLQEKREAEAIRREKAHLEWEIQRKKQEAEEVLRLQEAAKCDHTKALARTTRSRQEDLVKASEWWKIHRGIEDFIGECERRWTTAQAGQLTPEQQAWAAWAREVAMSASPFDTGYPEPARDGAFDPAIVPFGGPYPLTRGFPQPPTMPEIPVPVVAQPSHDTSAYRQEPKPYPFWLKYQRR